MNSNNEKDTFKGYLTPSQGAQLPSKDFREVLPNFDYSPGLHDLLDILMRRKWTIFIALILALVPTLIYNVNLTPIYQASAWLEITPYASRVTKFQEVSDPFEGDEFAATQLMLLQSGALARRVAASLQLEEHPFFNPPPEQATADKGILHQAISAVLGIKRKISTTVKSWVTSDKKKTGPLDPDLIKLREEKAFEGYILGNLTVTPQSDSSLVSITFDSEDPALARDIANSLVNQFIDWQMGRKVEASKTAKQQLETQILLARDRLARTEDELNKFAKDKGIVSLDSKSNIVYQQLEQINAALAKIEADRIAKEVNYNQARNNDLNVSPSVQHNALIEGLRNQYLALLSEYEKLRVRYKDEHPTMKSLKAQLLEVSSRINLEQERILNVVKNEYLSTLNTEKALKTTAEEKKALALKLNELASDYKILEREVEVNKGIYQSLLERSKEIAANVGTDLSNIKVVDLATLPLKPYKPNVPRNLFLAFIIGAVLGVGLALLIEHLDDSLKLIDEIPGRYWIPILGVVPMAQKSEKKNLESLVRLKPSSAFSEAIRIIRVAIQTSRSIENPVKSLLLTSSTKGEGKSTIAANLAQSLALSNEKVLLIEADLRRPSISHYFSNNGKSRGLSEFLDGACKYEEIIQKTGMHNLYFIPAGAMPSNPSELLMSQKMRSLLESAAHHFDRIVLDGPPFTSDALTLGNQVDRVILVATLGQTPREALKVFRKDLAATQAQLLGCIINMLNVNRYSKSSFYHSYYKCYEDSYGCTDDNLPAPIKHR